MTDPGDTKGDSPTQWRGEAKRAKTEAIPSTLTFVLTGKHPQRGVLPTSHKTIVEALPAGKKPFFQGMTVAVAKAALDFLDAKEWRKMQERVSQQLVGKLDFIRSWRIDFSDRRIYMRPKNELDNPDKPGKWIFDVTRLLGPCHPETLHYLSIHDAVFSARAEFGPLPTPNLQTFEWTCSMLPRTQIAYPPPLSSWPKLTRAFFRGRWTAPGTTPLGEYLVDWVRDKATAKQPIHALGCVELDFFSSGPVLNLDKINQAMETLDVKLRPTHVEFTADARAREFAKLFGLLPKLTTLRLAVSELDQEYAKPYIHQELVLEIAKLRQLTELRLTGYEFPDLSPLAPLVELRVLQVSTLQASDLNAINWQGVLRGCRDMKHLTALIVPMKWPAEPAATDADWKSMSDEDKANDGWRQMRGLWPQLTHLSSGLHELCVVDPPCLRDMADFLRERKQLKNVEMGFGIYEAEHTVPFLALMREFDALFTGVTLYNMHRPDPEWIRGTLNKKPVLVRADTIGKPVVTLRDKDSALASARAVVAALVTVPSDELPVDEYGHAVLLVDALPDRLQRLVLHYTAVAPETWQRFTDLYHLELHECHYSREDPHGWLQDLVFVCPYVERFVARGLPADTATNELARTVAIWADSWLSIRSIYLEVDGADAAQEAVMDRCAREWRSNTGFDFARTFQDVSRLWWGTGTA